MGTVIPGVIMGGEFSGDRADVRCAARWASGHWALEVARRLDTTANSTSPIKSGVFMRVAAFDHSQIRHTRHVRPIRLEVDNDAKICKVTVNDEPFLANRGELCSTGH